MIDKINSEKRRAKILEKLEQEGHVTTHSLSDTFKVSEVTIRNDLLLFEKKVFSTEPGAVRFATNVLILITISVKNQENI